MRERASPAATREMGATQAASENEERRDGVKAKMAAGAAYSRNGYRFCRRRADGQRRGTHALASGSSAIRTAAITPTTRLATQLPRRLRSLVHASRQSSCELRQLRPSTNGQPVVSASVVEQLIRPIILISYRSVPISLTEYAYGNREIVSITDSEVIGVRSVFLNL